MAHINGAKVVIDSKFSLGKHTRGKLMLNLFFILVCKLSLDIICCEDCRYSSMEYYEKQGKFLQITDLLWCICNEHEKGVNQFYP